MVILDKRNAETQDSCQAGAFSRETFWNGIAVFMKAHVVFEGEACASKKNDGRAVSAFTITADRSRALWILLGRFP